MIDKEIIISKWKAEMYDKNERDVNDVKLLLSILNKKTKQILEVACGTGRILVPLAKAGYKITGIDLDEYMLSRIAAKAVGLNNIFYQKADIIYDDWGNDFDVVILSCNILYNIISDIEYKKAQQIIIEKASKSLVKGGLLFIDYGYTASPEKWFNNPKENIIWEGTDSNNNYGKMSICNSTYDKKTRLNKFIRRFELKLPSGTKIVKEYRELKYFASLEEIRFWLSSYGFIVLNEYGDYNQRPMTYNTSKAIVLAKKQ